MNQKIEDMLDAINLGKVLHKNESTQKKDNKYIIAIIVCGVVAIVGIFAFTMYKIFVPKIKKGKHRSTEFSYDFDDDDDFSFYDDYASDDED